MSPSCVYSPTLYLKNRNTCIFYKKPFAPFPGNMTDSAYITGCLNAGEKVEWGCSTTAPTSGTFIPNKQAIKSRQNNECIDVYQANKDDGIAVDTYGCHGGDNQKWTYDAKRRLVAKHSGKCLDIPGPGAKQPKGTRVRQWDCNDGANQKWTYNPTNKSFKSEDDNGLCLDMIKSGDSAGNVILWDCHGGENQQWYI